MGGFEFLEGIPGTLGGALRMNAGAHGSTIFDRVVSVEWLMPDGSLHEATREQMHPTYRDCPELHGAIVLSVLLRCEAAREAEAVSLRTHAPAPFTALTDLGLGGEITRRRGEYAICFPAPTDTVWSVAKRYHAPIATLTAANNLPAGVKIGGKDSLEGIKYLIV